MATYQGSQWPFHWTDGNKHICKVCKWSSTTFTQLSHNLHKTFTQISQNLHTTFTQVPHNFLITCTQLSHNFHTTCTQLAHYFHITFTQLPHNFFTNISQLSHNCLNRSWFVPFRPLFFTKPDPSCISLWVVMSVHLSVCRNAPPSPSY